MDPVAKKILEQVGILTDSLNGQMIPRETLLNHQKYEEIKKNIPELKEHFSSSSLTSLQKDAEMSQKWPLLNLVRQVLKSYKIDMKPVRNGYTKEGVKKYKRFFSLVQIENISSEKV